MDLTSEPDVGQWPGPLSLSIPSRSQFSRISIEQSMVAPNTTRHTTHSFRDRRYAPYRF
mgnify:CR=1 FL=1